jgi:hypothetical protein
MQILRNLNTVLQKFHIMFYHSPSACIFSSVAVVVILWNYAVSGYLSNQRSRTDTLHELSVMRQVHDRSSSCVSLYRVYVPLRYKVRL